MLHTIKEFWVRYRVYVLENKLRALTAVRKKLVAKGTKLTTKYEKYRAKMVK